MNWTPPAFERHQFSGRRSKAVSAIYTPEGWDTTGISFADYQTMHIHRREAVQERRLPTPLWVNNDEALREEILKACEKRLYLDGSRHIPGLTHQERQARIRQTERMHLKRWLVVLQRLRERFRTEPKETRPEETQLLNVDTTCCMLQRGSVAITVAIVHFYYRLGWNSVQVAQELRLHPPHVRQILARLLHAASGVPQVKYAVLPRSGPDFDLMMKWHSEGMPLDELTLRLRLLGYDPLKLSTVHRTIENIKEAHFQTLVEQVAEAEAVFARIPRRPVHGMSDAWKRPGFRDYVIDQIKASKNSPEGKKKLTDALNKAWAENHSERAAKQGTSLRTAWRNSEKRTRLVAGQKASWAPGGIRRTKPRKSFTRKPGQLSASMKASWARRKAIAAA